ncbi:hypothetical protein FSP39_013122 [Pinctada imbricata]|uniref:Adenosine deaminase n=1 Tax=Pinctada imbricata TaxID=66713 RepID=A0AA89BUM0_PINIB|nr:hypothetical protein FSP39_013122 [Pinctada imbricata]
MSTAHYKGSQCPTEKMQYSTTCSLTSLPVCVRWTARSIPREWDPTKKDAKTQAAKNAFNIILGLTSEDEEDDEGSVMFDALGRKLVLDQGYVDKNTAIQQSQTNAIMEKNPISRLQEYCAQRRVPFKILVSDKPGPNGYDTYVMINEETVAESFHKNKKDAKRMAAEEALEYLLKEEERKKMSAVTLSEEDNIAKMCHQFLEKKLLEVPVLRHTRMLMAAFIVKRGETQGEVVAMGTGHNVISSDSLTTDGRCVIDCHAVAVARRAFKKYLFKEMKEYYEGSKVISIFSQVAQNSHLLTLKDNVSIHLYLSQPPCGDYAYCVQAMPNPPLDPQQQELVNQGAHLPVFNENLPGWFCTKNEDNMVEAVEEDQEPEQLYEDLKEGEDVLVMSCSDKLLLWNVLGLQGSLFNLFCQPIYLSSITIGKEYDHGHFTRAVCCRVYDVLQESLPKGYHINHPVLTHPNLPFTLGGNNPTAISMNWSQGDDKIELVNGNTGRTDVQSPHQSGQTRASRLCKAGFLHRFKELMKVSKQTQFMCHASYCGAKQASTAYQAAKAAFKAHCSQIGVGAWVKKPRDLEIFQK